MQKDTGSKASTMIGGDHTNLPDSLGLNGLTDSTSDISSLLSDGTITLISYLYNTSQCKKYHYIDKRVFRSAGM